MTVVTKTVCTLNFFPKTTFCHHKTFFFLQKIVFQKKNCGTKKLFFTKKNIFSQNFFFTKKLVSPKNVFTRKCLQNTLYFIKKLFNFLLKKTLFTKITCFKKIPFSQKTFFSKILLTRKKLFNHKNF